jgi:hypothetical protein
MNLLQLIRRIDLEVIHAPEVIEISNLDTEAPK